MEEQGEERYILPDNWEKGEEKSLHKWIHENWIKYLVDVKEGEGRVFSFESEPFMYVFIKRQSAPGGIEVAVYRSVTNVHDRSAWSAYYSSIENFEKYCADGAADSPSRSEEKLAQDKKFYRFKTYVPEPAIAEQGQMMFTLKNGYVLVLSEDCGANFRKHLDMLRDGKAPELEAKLCSGSFTLIIPAIRSLTREAPVAIYKTIDDFLKFHSEYVVADPDEERMYGDEFEDADDSDPDREFKRKEDIGGRLPKWMKREDFKDEHEWELTKSEYGVD